MSWKWPDIVYSWVSKSYVLVATLVISAMSFSNMRKRTDAVSFETTPDMESVVHFTPNPLFLTWVSQAQALESEEA